MAAQAGRPGAGSATVGAQGPQTDPLLTHMTGEPGGTPDGHPTRINPAEDVQTRRSIEQENTTAAVLADGGFRIKQNPTSAEVAQARFDTGDIGKATSRPDYLLEGRVFDCYSPTRPTKSVRGIWGEVQEKVVERKQTQRVVVNLADWRGDVSALQKQFADWPIPGLKEVKVVTADGDIVQFPINRENVQNHGD